MHRKLIPFLLLGMLLSGCGMQLANRALNGNGSSPVAVIPVASSTEDPTQPPTQTPVPTSTATPVPTPDLSLIGLPAEAPGTTALDFAAAVCDATWFNASQQLPCPGDDSQSSTGYVMGLSGETQGLPSAISMILAYPPQVTYETIFSKYPPFVVEKGDRFRAVLACKLHTFCDVEFSLEYFDGKVKNGIANWPYRFSAAPLVMDYPLDGIAGKTVQFGLAVRGNGIRTEAYAVWIDPHIYRPGH